jgi:hypothetical protein
VKTIRLTLASTFLVPILAGTAVAAGGCRLIRGAATPDTADDVQVCREDVWFHEGGSKVGNLAFTGQVSYPAFDTTRPTASIQSGGGAAYFGNELTQYGLGQDHPVHSVWFEGTVDGPIDNLAVDLYVITPGGDPVIGQYRLYTTLRVDGTTIYRSPYVGGDVATFSPGGQLGGAIRFAFTDLYEALEASDLAGAAQHSVRLAVSPYFVGDDAIYLYDSTDYPSGGIFNIQPTFLGAYSRIQVQGA